MATMQTLDQLVTPDQSTAELVDDLLALYDLCHRLYTQWRRQRGCQHHYQRPGCTQLMPCALSTSLAMGVLVREAFTTGLALLGPDYKAGDAVCRLALAAHLDLLRDQMDILQAAILAPGPLAIHTILQTSEFVRIEAIRTLAFQYRRLAAVRDDDYRLPRQLPVPQWRHGVQHMLALLPDRPPPLPSRWVRTPYTHDYDDDTATLPCSPRSLCSKRLTFPSEPPLSPLIASTDEPPMSPPLSQLTVPFFVVAASSKPKNSVFHIFCPEAMALQVDVRRLVPAARRCRCGFRWHDDRRTEATAQLKDGFCLSPRFLAKSHCEGTTSFGCVLCTSSGRAETFESVEDLRLHLNLVHDKWQMLHDRDMV